MEVICVVSEHSLSFIVCWGTDDSDEEEVIITAAPGRGPKIMPVKVCRLAFE